MDARTVVRLGGVCGLLYAVLLVPAYFVGFPTVVAGGASAQEVIGNFNDALNTYLLTKGTLIIFCIFFFLWFLGILSGVLRDTEDEGRRLSSVALAGGVMYATLEGAAVTVEVVIPAALVRFANFQLDA